MSDKECQHQTELVALLGGAADRELGRHVETCARCQAELALLRDGFAALGEDLESRDAQAQQRIAARVLPPILADLAPAAAPLEVIAPDRPAPSNRRRRGEISRSLRFGALTTLAIGPAGLYWLKGGAAAIQPGWALGIALLPLGLLPAAVSSPRLQRVALGLAVGITAVAMLATVDNFDLTILRGAACLLLAASGSLLPAIVVLRAAHKEHTSGLSGALLGAAIGSGGAALQRLLCGLGDLSHALVFHLGPFFFLIALAGLIGSRIGRAQPDPVSAQAA